MQLNLDKKIINQIIEIITKHRPVQKIIIFGSRATSQNTPSSDIDIAIIDPDWSSRDINIVKNELDENIKTPLKLDLLHYNSLNKESLKQAIIEDGFTIYNGSNNTSKQL